MVAGLLVRNCVGWPLVVEPQVQACNMGDNCRGSRRDLLLLPFFPVREGKSIVMKWCVIAALSLQVRIHFLLASDDFFIWDTQLSDDPPWAVQFAKIYYEYGPSWGNSLRVVFSDTFICFDCTLYPGGTWGWERFSMHDWLCSKPFHCMSSSSAFFCCYDRGLVRLLTYAFCFHQTKL
jgi:hypothetical protein